MKLFIAAFISTLVLAASSANVCTVVPDPNGGDDAPSIIAALAECSEDATVMFSNETHHIESVMSTHGLRNVTIDLQGTLLWGTNITYWRNNSLPLGYQNQSVAWDFGGDDVTFVGHGYGTFDGNGQIWYDFSGGVSNLAGRPINFVLRNSTNFVMSGVRFVQSQFWSTAVFNVSNVLMEDIFVSSTSNNGAITLNTDGLDSFYTNNITLRNWQITNGDDAIAPKANTSNMVFQGGHFTGGSGFAIGSIGQYLGVFEFIENVTVEDVVCDRCLQSAYVKTWTGVQQGFPPNGGGGGLGFARNIVFRNFTVSDLRDALAVITQCTSFEGATGGCDTSLFQLSNISWVDMAGTINTATLASLQCSGSVPCPDITIADVDGVKTNGTAKVSCSNVDLLGTVSCTT